MNSGNHVVNDGTLQLIAVLYIGLCAFLTTMILMISLYLQRATPTKMALAYAGEDYKDIVYNFAATEGADDHWGSQKFNLDLAFPNLPWYIDDNVKLTQSNAIVR